MSVRADGEVVVRQYGLLEPLDWGEDCLEHLYLQNRLWNRLVEIDHEAREAVQALTKSDKRVQALQEKIEGKLALRAALDKERKALRQRARKNVDTSLQQRQIKKLSGDIKDLTPKLKEARRRARERQKPTLEVIDTRRFEAAKEARQQSGLWWGNYNAVCASYERARGRAMPCKRDVCSSSIGLPPRAGS